MECTHALLMIRICSGFAHAHALECIATDKIALAVTIMAFKNSLSWVLHTSTAQLHIVLAPKKESVKPDASLTLHIVAPS